MGICVFRIAGQRLTRPSPGIFEAAGHQQQSAGLQLGIDIVRQEVRGPDVFAERRVGLSKPQVRIAKLQSDVAASGVCQ